MTTTAAVQSVIEVTLKTWADADGFAKLIEWENVDFTPPNNAAYLQFHFMPAQTRSADLQGVINTYLGVVQINVVGLPGPGRGPTSVIASQIECLFPAAKQMTDGTITVVVVSPAASGRSVPDNGRFTIPVSFTYRCDA
jgi:Bacteriophage related domain of unknown function